MRLSSLSVVCLATGGLANDLLRQQDAVAINGTETTVVSSDTRGIKDELSGLGEKLKDKLKTTAKCAACLSGIGVLKMLALIGDDLLIRAFQNKVCPRITMIMDIDFCIGTAEIEGPVFLSAINGVDILDITATSGLQLCAGLVGMCPYPEVEEWSVPFPSEKPNRKRPVSKGNKTIKVVHYSDIHIDPLYTVGASTGGNKKISCRPDLANDTPALPGQQAGPYGDHNCDIPVSLEKSMYKAIREIVPDAAFSLFTGDLIHHAMWNTSEASNTHEIHDAYRLMDGLPGLVYGTAGNHENHPSNAFEPPEQGKSSQWLYNLLSDEWSTWIDPEAAERAEKMGAYSTKYPRGNLRIISLNTNYNYRHNFYLYRKKMAKDPSDQIKWLVRELHAAEKAGENVYIIGHMPFSTFDSIHDQSNYLDQVVNRFEATIAGMFFGHTHQDEFKISYSDNKQKTHENAIVTSWVAPSLTPTAGHPAFKVYEVDAETFAVLDATTYIADMTNEAYQITGPVWTKYYSAKETYGKLLDFPITDAKAELSAAFWHNVTEVFFKDDKAFAEYSMRKSRGWKWPGWEACVGDCQNKEICKMRAGRSQDNCHAPKAGFGGRKRDVDQAIQREDRLACGYSPLREVVAALFEDEDAMDELREEVKAEARKRGLSV